MSRTLGTPTPAATGESPPDNVVGLHRRFVVTLSYSGLIAAAWWNKTVPILPQIAEDFGVPIGMAGQLNSVASLTALTLGWFLASLSDRWGRRRLIGMALAWAAITSAVLALAPNFTVALVVRFLGGAVTPALAATCFAAVGDVTDARSRSAALSWVSGALGLSPTLAWPMMGFITEAVGWRAAVWLFTVMAALGSILAYRLLPCDRVGLEAVANTPGTGIRELVRQMRWAYPLYAAFFLTAVGWFGWLTYIGGYYSQAFAWSSGAIGLVLGLGGLVFLGAGFVVTNCVRRFGFTLTFVVIVLLAGLAGLSFALPNCPWPVVVAAGYMLTVGRAFANVLVIGTVLKWAGSHRGALMGINETMLNGGAVLGSFLGGMLWLSGGSHLWGAGIGLLWMLSALLLVRFRMPDGGVGPGVRGTAFRPADGLRCGQSGLSDGPEPLDRSVPEEAGLSARSCSGLI